MTSRTHKPVLLAEVLALVPDEAQLVFDGTIGGGGHAKAILGKLGPEVEMIGFDRDEEALKAASHHLTAYQHQVQLVHDSYANISQRLGDQYLGRLDFALLDLGLSSLQLEGSNRGFSFQQSQDPLDLRFDGTSGDPVNVKLSSTTVDELTTVLNDFGELRNVRRMANDIIAASDARQLKTVDDLVKLVAKHFPGGKHNQFFAKVWQALRIWVNDELTHLQTGLEQLVKYLRPGGILAVISFHSLEDRLVKNYLVTLEKPCVCPKSIPVCVCGRVATLVRINRKAIKATEEEIAQNPRARSARLRAARKLAIC